MIVIFWNRDFLVLAHLGDSVILWHPDQFYEAPSFPATALSVAEIELHFGIRILDEVRRGVKIRGDGLILADRTVHPVRILVDFRDQAELGPDFGELRQLGAGDDGLELVPLVPLLLDFVQVRLAAERRSVGPQVVPEQSVGPLYVPAVDDRPPFRRVRARLVEPLSFGADARRPDAAHDRQADRNLGALEDAADLVVLVAFCPPDAFLTVLWRHAHVRSWIQLFRDTNARVVSLSRGEGIPRCRCAETQWAHEERSEQDKFGHCVKCLSRYSQLSNNC